MDELILFTIDCPKCNILKKKLDNAGLKYKTVSDVAEMKNTYCIDTDNTFFPLLGILKDDGTGEIDRLLEYRDAVNYVNSRS